MRASGSSNSGASTRSLILCADDFGMSPGVSQAIARLAHARRLNAATCLTTSVLWPDHAPLLRELPGKFQVGLHFNLTEGRPLSKDLARHWPALPGLPRLIVLAHLRALPLHALAAEFRAQRDAFEQALGRSPQFVDGHQHVHHLPGVRDVLLQALPPLLPVRNTGTVIGPAFAVKRWLIEHTGGTALQRALQQRGTPHNPALLGVYDFRPVHYRQQMQRWLAQLPAGGGLLFCHPGDADVANRTGHSVPDPIAAARVHESAYLGSEAFADDLAEAGVQLTTAWGRSPAELRRAG